jgi:UDP-GlcNAc:undecaprenyl-phosphate GlcNAc-1-phosphate transferase
LAPELRLVLAVALAGGATALLTPLARRLALRSDFVDRPEGYKRHAADTPYLGGLAVLAGFLVAALAVGGAAGRYWPLAVGAVVLWGLGTLDDRRTVRPSYRVAVEAALGIGLWAADLGWSGSGSAVLDCALTAAWVVAVVNAINLLDNIDGAAAVVALACAVGIAAVALERDADTLAALALGLAGACAGFLPLNLSSPARIFMGDGGSMPIGWLLAGTITALPHLQGGAHLLGVLPLVGIPLVDTGLVIVSRLRRGVPVIQGGRDHLTHRLLAWLGTPRVVAAAIGGAQLALSAVALGALAAGRLEMAVVGTIFLAVAATVIALLETPQWTARLQRRPS